MLRTLFAKEVREHLAALVLLAVLLLLGFLFISLGVLIREEPGSFLETLRYFLVTMAPIAAAVLGGRLVAKEYGAKTQLFLEGMPVSRPWMLAAKLILGLGLLMLVVTAVFGISALVARAREGPLAPRFLSIVALKTCAFCLCAHSFFFLTGLLGRYRIAAYLGCVFGLFVLETQLRVDLSRSGPFALVNDTFSFERVEFPIRSLVVTLALSLSFLGLAFALALLREGSVASLLAEKMTHREKVFLSMLGLFLLYGVGIAGDGPDQEPFDLHDALLDQRDGILVKVDPAGGEAAGRRLLGSVITRLASLRDYLDLPHLPPVFLVARRDLDAGRFEQGWLAQAEGVLARANWGSDSFKDDAFISWLVPAVVGAQSLDRLRGERWRWVLDGFGPYWTRRTGAARPMDPGDQLTLRALHGTAEGNLEQDLRSWLSFRERVGDEIASAVAWSGLRTLARLRGEERTRAFLGAVLGPGPPDNIRALWTRGNVPPERALRDEAGVSWEALLDAWRGELEALRKACADRLARVPRLGGELRFVPASPETRKAVFRAACTPPPAGGRVSLLYKELPVLDQEEVLEDLRRETVEYPQEEDGQLEEAFPRGARFYWAFSVEAEELGCEVISGFRRVEVR